MCNDDTVREHHFPNWRFYWLNSICIYDSKTLLLRHLIWFYSLWISRPIWSPISRWPITSRAVKFNTKGDKHLYPGSVPISHCLVGDWFMQPIVDPDHECGGGGRVRRLSYMSFAVGRGTVWGYTLVCLVSLWLLFWYQDE